MMELNFDETLELHLESIKNHDLESFRKTLHTDPEIVCIEPNGDFIKSSNIFIQNHVDWFGCGNWGIDFEILDILRSSEISIVTSRIIISEEGKTIDTILTLIFQLINGKWGLVHDQNTPILTE